MRRFEKRGKVWNRRAEEEVAIPIEIKSKYFHVFFVFG